MARPSTGAPLSHPPPPPDFGALCSDFAPIPGHTKSPTSSEVTMSQLKTQRNKTSSNLPGLSPHPPPKFWRVLLILLQSATFQGFLLGGPVPPGPLTLKDSSCLRPDLGVSFLPAALSLQGWSQGTSYFLQAPLWFLSEKASNYLSPRSPLSTPLKSFFYRDHLGWFFPTGSNP